MAITETIKSSAYRVYDAASAAWKKYSFWNQASDTVYTDGKNAQTKNGAINGITSSLASTATDIAASASTVNTLYNNLSQLNSDLNKVNVYVGSDNKLHFVNRSGADTALPFSNDISGVSKLSSKATTGSNGETISVTYTCDSDKMLLVCGGARCDGNTAPNAFSFGSAAIPAIDNVLVVNDASNAIRLYVGIINAHAGDIISCTYTISGRYTSAYLEIAQLI